MAAGHDQVFAGDEIDDERDRIFGYTSLGSSGAPIYCLPADQVFKIDNFNAEPWAGRSHWLTKFAEEPPLARRVRPYLIFTDAPLLIPPPIPGEPLPTPPLPAEPLPTPPPTPDFTGR